MYQSEHFWIKINTLQNFRLYFIWECVRALQDSRPVRGQELMLGSFQDFVSRFLSGLMSNHFEKSTLRNLGVWKYFCIWLKLTLKAPSRCTFQFPFIYMREKNLVSLKLANWIFGVWLYTRNFIIHIWLSGRNLLHLFYISMLFLVLNCYCFVESLSRTLWVNNTWWDCISFSDVKHFEI